MTEAKPHPGEPFFVPVAERLGRAYLRYTFTRGTDQEAKFLLDVLDLEPGARVLDVGCGPGRHVVALARAGLNVTGVDVSQRFLDIAAQAARDAGVGASLFQVDARSMPFEDEFDAVISICQGGFGLMGNDDGLVLRRIAEAVKPEGRVLLTAFNAYYSVRNQLEQATFDADTGIVHESAPIRDETGAEERMDLWTGVYTPRELRLLAIGVGLVPEHVWGVEPGDFARRPADIDRPEFMLVARKPPS